MDAFCQNKDILKAAQTRNSPWEIGLNIYSPSIETYDSYFLGMEQGQLVYEQRPVQSAYFGLGLSLSYKGWTLNYYHHFHYTEADRWAWRTIGGLDPITQYYYQEINPRLRVPRIIGFANLGYQFPIFENSFSTKPLSPLLGIYAGIDNFEVALGIKTSSWNILIGMLVNQEINDLQSPRAMSDYQMLNYLPRLMYTRSTRFWEGRLSFKIQHTIGS